MAQQIKSELTTEQEISKQQQTLSTPKSPKKLELSKVKEMVLIFNSEKSHLIKCHSVNVKCSILENKVSEEANLPEVKVLQTESISKSNCFVPEDVSGNLTVKDKVKLYNQYIENMNKDLKKIKQQQKDNFTRITSNITPSLAIKKISTSEEIANSSTSQLTAPILARRHSLKRKYSDNLAKQTENEGNELGLYTLSKTSKDELQSVIQEKTIENNEQNFDFTKPSRPLSTRNCAFQQELFKKKYNQISSSFDFETENQRNTLNKTNPVYTLDNMQPAKEEPQKLEPLDNANDIKKDVAVVAKSFTTSLNQGLETETRKMYSPVASPNNKSLHEKRPSVSTGAIRKIPKNTSISIKDQRHNSLPCRNPFEQQSCCSVENKMENRVRSTYDKMTSSNQGLETESRKMDSPVASSKNKSSQEMRLGVSTGAIPKIAKNTSGLSKPIKDQRHHSIPCRNSAKQQPCCFVENKMENRRKSTYDKLTSSNQGLETKTRKMDSSVAFRKTPKNTSIPANDQRRNSLPCRNTAKQQSGSSVENKTENRRRSTGSRRSSLGIKMIREYEASEQQPDNKKLNDVNSSQFWIKCGHFSICLDIDYSNPKKTELFYEMFCKTSCVTKVCYFGIDNYKFSIHNPSNYEYISIRLSALQDKSHYWFSSGDLTIPFSGKFLTPRRIKRIFKFIKTSVQKTGSLQFGVDAVEFSYIPKFWNSNQRMPMKYNYSLLLDEELNKFAWPHTKVIKAASLDESNFNDENDLEIIEWCRLPFASNLYDLSVLNADELATPRNSDVIMNLESYCYHYECEPIENLFENNFVENSEKTDATSEILETLQNEQLEISLNEKTSKTQRG